jgi:UDP-N-acetylmuramoyl-tripeptide--D-alanyl-D-alanine ligase
MNPLWTCEEIAHACEGKRHGQFACNSVTFDSREVEPGALFVALKGTQADGHEYVDAAFERGATGALVSRPVPHPHVLVPDTQAGLEALGRVGRARALSATVVGVTGSVGKTTTKELIRSCFEPQGRTHASVKSYNNHTGVPLSLARMPSETRWAVFEMGMNHAGEIAALTDQVRPDIAVITWIAPAHIENLGSLEAIAEAKAEIFRGLEQGGAAIYPAAAPHADLLAKRARGETSVVMSFGFGPSADIRPEAFIEDEGGSRFELVLDGVRYPVRVPQPGRHRVLNALATLAAVSAAGADVGAAVDAIGQSAELAGRGARRTIPLPGGGEALLIDESYNANPASMAAALAVLEALAAPRKIAVLGAMRELGGFSDQYHRELAPLIERAGVAHAILVGPEMAPLAAELPGAVHVGNWPDALAAVREMVVGADAVLVKGSNSVGLARLVAALEGR